MPFFRYSARDAKGQTLEGTIKAADPNEAVAELTRRGFRSPQILDLPQPAPAAQPQGPQPIRTRKINDRIRFFLFTQISDQLRAGVNPANAFTAIAAVSRIEPVRQSLQRAGEHAAQGGQLSEVLGLYPDLYPQHVAYTLRAGEEGGFLPASCMYIAEQANSAYKFKRFHWFIWFAAANALLAIPLTLVATSAIMKAWRAIDATGGEGGAAGGITAMLKAFWEVLVWPLGPIILLCWGFLGLLYLYFSSSRFKMMRHRLGLYWPVLGARAKHEGITAFTWTLSHLSQAGLSPYRSWEVAAKAVPNLVLSEKIVEVGKKIEAGTKLSEAVFGSNLFPQEYAGVLSTGEMTGDVPSALNRLADMTRTEFEAQTAYAKLRTSGWGCLAIGVTAGIVLILLILFFYYQLPSEMLRGLEPPE